VFLSCKADQEWFSGLKGSFKRVHYDKPNGPFRAEILSQAFGLG
jgi:hypothetical protein